MRDDILEVARTYAEEVKDEEIELLRTLSRIPAPTRDEGRRASFVYKWLKEAGAPESCLEIDRAGNVVLRLNVDNKPADGTRDLVVYAAHMDVVFPDAEPLPLREERGRMYAPGIGDDTANLVGLLMAARWLLHHPEYLSALGHGILVVADTCEEGLGNLDGTKELFRRYADRISAFVTFDLFVPTLVNTAVGSHRWRLTVDGPGGHSYFDYGAPNAIEMMARLVGRLATMPLAGEDVTRNIGRIEGGTTINSIPEHCGALFEYRSTSEECLQEMSYHLKAEVDTFRRELCGTKDVEVTLELMGGRPGMGPVDEKAQDVLIQRCANAIRHVTGDEPHLTNASTDANVPLSCGIPACCVGTIRGHGLHTRDEWVETASLRDGLAIILTIMLEI